MLPSAIYFLASFTIGLLVGVHYGRRQERLALYDRLLSSTNPESWNAAIHVSQRITAQEVASTQDSDQYSPTPVRSFPALVDRHATTRAHRVRPG